MNDLEYGMDPLGKTRFYGVYRAKVIDINDPLKKQRIRVQVPQVLGTSVTGWANACLPVTSNGRHPKHKEHTSAEVAALLQNHSATFTASGGDHSHSVTVTFSHAGQSGQKLLHPHLVSSDPQDRNDLEIEHTRHRVVPRIGQNVWIMFEGGDPEFPVWMGVFGEGAFEQ